MKHISRDWVQGFMLKLKASGSGVEDLVLTGVESYLQAFGQ